MTGRAIILAAGRGAQLDGINKCLLRHPQTGLTIIDHAVRAFSGFDITVVVGFRAIQVMERYPDLDYVINHEWAVTNNAMSLGLALSDKPSFVVSGDIFFDRPLIERLLDGPENMVLTSARENRSHTAIHCVVDGSARITETYTGPIRNIGHPEAIGLFRVSDVDLLRRWKRSSITFGNLFVGQTLPCDREPLISVPLVEERFEEINTPSEYLQLIRRWR
jgi:choline kinase